MILINLLPHRDERRKRKKIAFFVGHGRENQDMTWIINHFFSSTSAR